MGVLDSIRRLFGRADDATGGRFYDAVEKADEEAGELLERLHLEDEPDGGAEDEATDAAPDAGASAS